MKPRNDFWVNFDLFELKENVTFNYVTFLTSDAEKEWFKNIKFSFARNASSSKGKLRQYMVLVKEEYDENNRTYNREFHPYLVDINKPATIGLVPRPFPNLINPLNQALKNINNTWDLIGIFGTRSMNAFFRYGSNIMYCPIDEVYTYLISNFICFERNFLYFSVRPIN